MPVSSIAARHREAGHPTTALSGLAGAASGTLVVVGRRSAVAAAASGILMSVFAAPASAAPSPENAARPPLWTRLC